MSANLVSALWANRTYIVHEFETAVASAMKNAWARCAAHSRTPQEPDFVASLIVDGVPTIHRGLSAALSPNGLTVSVGGVFCHQSPKVSHAGAFGGRCELGDLLVIFSHHGKGAISVRNALLLQAKTSDRQPKTVSGPELIQLEIYETWPSFTYTTPQRLKGKARTVQPHTPHQGAQYLLLDNRAPTNPLSGLAGVPGTFPAGCCMPARVLHIHSDFASALFELLLFTTGRPFVEKAVAKSGWSAVVWDLIDVGLNRMFNRRCSGHSNAEAYRGGPVLYRDVMSVGFIENGVPSAIASESLGVGGIARLVGGEAGADGDKIDRQREDDDDGAGPSLLLIETRELE